MERGGREGRSGRKWVADRSSFFLSFYVRLPDVQVCVLRFERLRRQPKKHLQISVFASCKEQIVALGLAGLGEEASPWKGVAGLTTCSSRSDDARNPR